MTNNYDVIIMGGGIAGLYAALNLDKNLHVLLLSKRELSLSNSNLAQGGIAAVFDTRTFFERPKMNLRMPSDVRSTVTSRDDSCAQMSPYLTIGPAIS